MVLIAQTIILCYIIICLCELKESLLDTYYEEIIKEVKKLMAKGDYQEAYEILEEELSMPYIPKESEQILISQYNECRSALNFNRREKTYDDEDIATLLQGSLEEQYMAVELLKKSNLRNHLEEVQAYLSKCPHILIRSLLIEALMEQNIAEEIRMNYEDDLEITFYPCYIEAPMKTKGATLAANTLCDWFENDDPTFLKMCIDSLIKELYLRLPFNLEEDEASHLAQSVVSYVFKAGQNEEGYQHFLATKQLTQEISEPLLLSKYGL